MAGKVKQTDPLPPGKGQRLAFAALTAAATLSALGVVWSTHGSRHLLNELQGLEERRNALQVEWRQLLLEQSSMVSQGRIEQIAISELGMVVPAMDELVVVGAGNPDAAKADGADGAIGAR